MSGRSKHMPGGRGWRRIALAAGCAAGMAGGVFWFRSTLLPRARAVPPPAEARAGATVSAISAEPTRRANLRRLWHRSGRNNCVTHP